MYVKGIHLKIEQRSNSQVPVRLEREIAQSATTKQPPALACVEELMEWAYDSLQERFLEDFFSSYEYRVRITRSAVVSRESSLCSLARIFDHPDVLVEVFSAVLH